MGNRAVITHVEPSQRSALGVYVHWNGGPESVLAFLDAAKAIGVRNPHADASYGYAGLAYVIGLYMASDGEQCSHGVDALGRLDCDNGDNGTYQIGPDWQVVKRHYVVDGSPAVGPIVLADPWMVGKHDAIVAAILKRHKLVVAAKKGGA